jgi:hypothetical protein
MTPGWCLRISHNTKYRIFRHLDAVSRVWPDVRCNKSVGFLYKRRLYGDPDYVYRPLKH